MEIPSDMEMQVSTVNNAQLDQDNEKEAEAPQSLSTLVYLVLERAGLNLGNQNAPCVHEQAVSKI